MAHPSVVLVIPARYAATRLPGKPLVLIHGKTMIEHVWRRCIQVRGVDQVWVATEDERVATVVRSFGGQVCLTSPDLASGTDRVAAVAEKVPADLYVNVQGDEPLMDPRGVEKAIALVQSGQFPVGTLQVPFRHESELGDLAAVKVICDASGRALYFSRHPIPYSRGERPSDPGQWICQRHVGVYVYTREALQLFVSLPPSRLEQAEVLEQLRALEAGLPIGVAQAHFESIGVDTPRDLEKVRELLV
jgi:3-deoxy-D-manno-octulosonate cytidylyltransferase